MADKDVHPADISPASAPAGAESSPDAVTQAGAMPATPLQRLRLVGLVILKRVRFIAVLAAVGVFIGSWDSVMNYWEKWTQPQLLASHALEPGQEFYCPMDPQVVRSTYEPNGDVPKCPICGMPLSERKKGEKAKLPEGITARVQFTPERIQLAGIRTSAVEYRPVVKQTRTVGYVTFDESRLSRVVSRVDGYVEKLYVDKTFTFVHKGDPLAEIYSPELYVTARELAMSSQGSAAGNMAAVARSRLSLLGVDQKEIDAIVASRDPSPRLVIRSPQTGYVVDKKIVVGASVDAKMTLLDVADLSTVWVEADVFEKDIPFLQVGQNVEATVEAYPDRTFSGKLALIQPQLQATTRTNRVRLELDNPRHELLPGMFATVQIHTPLESIEPYKSAAAKAPRIVLASGAAAKVPAAGVFLVVPERAVIDTGAQKVVYVEREAGIFEGVEVQLGPRQGEVYPVFKGLNPGDRVATAGGFLIDAETRLNPAAAATYFGASGGPQSTAQPAGPAVPNSRSDDRVPAAPTGPDSKPPKEPKLAVARPTADDLKNIEQLPEADRPLAMAQRICPVTGAPLGSMGVPIKITLRGQTVFLCCKGCIGKAKRSPDAMLAKLAKSPQEPKR